MDTEHTDSGSENDPNGLKRKYHSAKMDLNLKILRDQMSGLADKGNSLSRQMASMYRTLKEVKDDNDKDQNDASSDEEIDSGDEADVSTVTKSMEALDTEDDLNKMSDLDSCSYPGKKSTRSQRGSGLCKSPKKLSVCDNRKYSEVDDDETPQASPNVQNGSDFTFPTNKTDNTISPMSLTLTSTDHEVNRKNAKHHHHHKNQRNCDSDSDESLPDSSSDECSRCLCCSSLASYQGIPWRIQRRDSATTTEASDSSEYCSDSDTEEGHKRVPLYAKLSPFFFQECYVSGDEDEGTAEEAGEKMDETADSLPGNYRPGPVGCETQTVEESKCSPSTPGATDTKSLPPPKDKPAKHVESETIQNKDGGSAKQSEPTEEEELDEKSSASVSDKIKNFQSQIVPGTGSKKTSGIAKQKKESDKSKQIGTQLQSIETQTDAEPDEQSEEVKTPVPEDKPKRHVSKSMFLVARPKEGDKKANTAVLTSPDSLIEIPASCIDRDGRVTLRPDPKLAPEAYKQGKTIKFQVRSTGDGVVATDGPLILTPGYHRGAGGPHTVYRVGAPAFGREESFRSASPESQVEVTPEGVIKIKRRTVPVRINPVQTITIGGTSDNHSGCSHCHRHAAADTAPGNTQLIPQPSSTIITSSPQIITRQITTQRTPAYSTQQSRRIVISPQGAGQPSQQVTIGPQQQQGPIRLISVTPTATPGPYRDQAVTFRSSGDGAPQQVYQLGGGQPQIIRVMSGGMHPQTYQLGGNPQSQTFSFGGGPQTQTYQISGHPGQQVYQMGGQPSENMSIRMGNGETISFPIQRGQQGMRFVINQ